jgi:Holliday junction resolvase RusA-like endonuclease
MSFACFIPGPPRGKGSVRVGKWGAYKDEKTDNYMALAILTMRVAKSGAAPIAVPTRVTLTAYFERPTAMVPKVGPRIRAAQPPSEPFPAPSRVDCDNISKALLDSLTQAGVIADDHGVVELIVRKFYVAVGDEPGVRVEVDPAIGCWSPVVRSLSGAA